MMSRLPRIGFVVSIVLLAVAPFGATAQTDNLAITTHVTDTTNVRVVDTRSLNACETASLPGARCLPLNSFINASGQQIGFHALRWLLGTVGLDGTEHVLVIGDNAQSARTVGTLIHTAGQHRVTMLDGAFASDYPTPGGQARSMSRETVFIAPMRNDIY